MNNTRGSTPPNPSLDLPNRSTGLNKTLGTIGTPHEESIAKFDPTKTCPNKRNQRYPAKTFSNPRTPKTPKSSPTRVLHFEDSGLRRRTPVRPVFLTGQTHRSDRSGTVAAPSLVLRSWLCGSTKEPSGFRVNHRKPRELGVASANLHS
jgi:hypothetical protein